ncbi:hypothetical protein GCM10007416_11300 [Kroppenstedtia guangzhouensis]|uniref:Uncharacterized protein n=1 Tax=Kroppenstedtia guangzhouensis TaxID=1274356 RepID=A0ABQ1GAW3_9BACL|nr:hypothetical protein GCM10007416_11300 [Kroppenstedtia guangzhouensis]
MRDAFAPPVNSVTSRKSKSTSDLIISPSGKNPGIIGHTLRHMCPYNKAEASSEEGNKCVFPILIP